MIPLVFKRSSCRSRLLPYARKDPAVPPRYVLKQHGRNQFVFTLRGSEEQVMLTSPAYPDRDSAIRGINSVRGNIRKKDRFVFHTATNGGLYFVLESAKKGVIGQSELYPDEESLLKGLFSVRRNALAAKLEDQTGGR